MPFIETQQNFLEKNNMHSSQVKYTGNTSVGIHYKNTIIFLKAFDKQFTWTAPFRSNESEWRSSELKHVGNSDTVANSFKIKDSVRLTIRQSSCDKRFWFHSVLSIKVDGKNQRTLKST